jgi:hypothetical protein
MVVTSFALLAARTAAAAPSSGVPLPASLHLALANPDDAPGATEAAASAMPVVDTLAETEVTRPPDLSYGVATRLRWVSVPKWLLNAFTTQNMPVSSWASALEVFRRKGDFEFAFSIGYQNMTPPDGNWLGKGNKAATDVDYVQVRGLGFLGLDVSFIWHSFITDWFGLHYGAGLGIATIFGTVNRTSNSGCTDANAGDITMCHPVGVNPGNTAVTIDRQIQNLGTGPDDPNNPHRFSDPNVPGFLPIVNLVLGVDFRLPRTRGWEAKIEGGFYDAFFLGGGIGYTF